MNQTNSNDMKPLLLLLLLSTAAWGQDKKTIVSVGYSRYQVSDSDMKDIIYDTIPVTILVRIQGRPWAFFHDGWEVRRKRNAPAYYHQYGDTIKLEPEPCKMIGCAANHFIISRTFPVDEFIGYLDTKKRPIRKEWVVYNKYQRQ